MLRQRSFGAYTSDSIFEETILFALNLLSISLQRSEFLLTYSNDISHHSAPQHPTKDVLSVLELLDAIPQELPLALCGTRFRRNGLYLRVGEAVDDDGRKDLLEAADEVALNDLRGDICNEGFLLDLQYMLVSSRNG